jgi:hypothetical protein
MEHFRGGQTDAAVAARDHDRFPLKPVFHKVSPKMEDERLLKTDGGRSRTAVRVRPS